MANKVLYIDHSGHPAPLSLTYHATASRVLSSSLPWTPPSTFTEIDTAYCHQCLYYASHASAATSSVCPNAECRSCPVCESSLMVGLEGDDIVYQCPYCRWSSSECNVKIKKETQEEDDYNILSKKRAERLAQELERQMSMYNKNNGNQNAFDSLVSQWSKRAQEEERYRRYGDGSSHGLGSSTRKSKLSFDKESWSIEALESTQMRKQSDLKTSLLENLTLDTANIQTQKLQFPQRIRLQPKKSRRCRYEMEKGKPGILVKPKTNPLEGDSSLRSGHGQWWKKDSSAIHMVPKVTLVKLIEGSDWKGLGGIIQVSNPTLGPVRVRFQLGTEEDIQKPRLHDLILDATMSNTTANAELISLPKVSAYTENIMLEPVEDAFLELGNRKTQIPSEVMGWKPNDLKSDNDNLDIGILAIEKDMAWIQFGIPESVSSSPRNTHDMWKAIQLTMEVEVGNGSWESSLIKRDASLSNEDVDWVPFQLVLVWK